MDRYAVAYMRRSHEDNGGQVSREDQQEAVASLADRHGQVVADEHLFVDWGRSGGDAPEDAMKHRPRFRAMVRAIEAGHVSHVFALRLDRLGRGQSALGALWGAAEATGTRIITKDEGDLGDTSDPAKWLLRHTLAGFAEYYLREQKRKAANTLSFQRRRGDDIGLPTLGHVMRREDPDNPRSRVVRVCTDPDAIAVVLDAYRQAGSYLGAARRLNAARVPVPLARQVRRDGKPYGDGRYAESRWHPGTVKNVVMREAPTMAPRRAFQRRSPVRRPRLFAGLLRCVACDHILTPGGSAAARSWNYWCYRAHRDPNHPAPFTVSEKRMLVWAREEAAHLHVPVPGYTTAGVDVDAERERINAGLRRAGIAYADGLLPEDEYDARKAKAKDDLRALAEVEAAVSVGVPSAIDWTADVQKLNEALRALWRHVDVEVVDGVMQPVRADWLVPEWRRD